MHTAYHSKDSEADNAQTPWWIISQIQEVANVNIINDVCAKKESAKANYWWDKEDDALNKNWAERYESINTYNNSMKVFWMNPPFSMAKEFTNKAADEALNGCVIIGCVKDAPDTDWFQEMEKRATFIYVPDRRIQFLKADGRPFTRLDKKTGRRVKSGANFPLCFPLWTPFNNGGEAKQIRFKCDKKRFE